MTDPPFMHVIGRATEAFFPVIHHLFDVVETKFHIHMKSIQVKL
jgi:hypothetical protein